MPRRLIQLFAGLVLYGISDSMLAARGHSLRVVRTGIEVTVLAIGWLLGGTVGIGTLVYAGCIGPLAHVFVPLFSRGDPAQGPVTSRGRATPRDGAARRRA